MTREEYMEIIKEEYKKVNPNSRESLHNYNEFKRELREQIDEDND